MFPISIYIALYSPIFVFLASDDQTPPSRPGKRIATPTSMQGALRTVTKKGSLYIYMQRYPMGAALLQVDSIIEVPRGRCPSHRPNFPEGRCPDPVIKKSDDKKKNSGRIRVLICFYDPPGLLFVFMTLAGSHNNKSKDRIKNRPAPFVFLSFYFLL